MNAALDMAVVNSFRLLPVSWSNFSILPVLHVERLHSDGAFQSVLRFCRDYTELTGCKAVATVIPPIAPILAEELKDAGFGEQVYADRIRQLAGISDIGLHGHYLRSASQADGPIHNYWNDRATVAAQMADEIAWLESRGLMSRRVYSAGWWYLDGGVRTLLERNRFEYDFSPSMNRYNLSLRGYSQRMRERSSGGENGRKRPGEIWAVAGVCAARRASSVPRHVFQRHWRSWLFRRKLTLSLYSHDWDMDPGKARTTIRDLKRLGVRFTQLSLLEGYAAQ